jgi:hypothetical protein
LFAGRQVAAGRRRSRAGARGCYMPLCDAAVRAMPARLLLLCLLVRSSWLPVEGDRHVGAPSECGIAGADGQPWPSRSAWLLAFRSGSIR